MHEDRTNHQDPRRLLQSVVDRVTAVEDDALLLRLRLALHAPRLGRMACVDTDALTAEALRLRSHVRRAQHDLDWRHRETPSDLSEFHVVPIPSSTADRINRDFHYIGTHRKGRHYGLAAQGMGTSDPPATLLTFSDLDLPHLASLLRYPMHDLSAIVLSRVYSFRWAPRNAFSFAFTRALRLLQQDSSSPDLILTYLNPNVGFTGASYRAAGWQLVAEEAGLNYFYVDGTYAPRRALHERFHTAEPAPLRALLGNRFSVSEIPLQPLHIFAFPLTPAAFSFLKEVRLVEIPHLS